MGGYARRRLTAGIASSASSNIQGRPAPPPLQPPPPSSLLPAEPLPVEIVPLRFTTRVVAPGLLTVTVPGVVPVTVGVKRK